MQKHIMEDQVDHALAQWQAECPELDLSPLAVLGRVFRLATIAMRNVDHSYRAHGLQQGEFDVLATLYRYGTPYALNPQRLAEALLLSSGAMTNRLDRLQSAGLLTRRPNLDDRRSVIVALTEEGLRVVKQALPGYMSELERLLKPLAAAERTQLAALLKTLLISHDVKASTGAER